MKNKAYKILMIVLFGLVLVLFPVMTFITMPQEARPFSENENRYLVVFPKFSKEAYLHENFMEGFERWFSDRFFGRETLIKTKNATERLIGKTNINGVFTQNNQMMEIWSGFDSEFIEKNISAINKFAANNPDKPVYFMLAPTSQEIYSYLMPSSMEHGSQAELFNFCREKLNGVQAINVMNTLKQHSDEYIYYRTDHHWTSLGAYLAYYEAASALGFKPTELSDFDIEHASYDFRGTLYSKTLDDGVTPDIIDYYHRKDENGSLKLTISDLDKTNTYDSLYFRDYLDVKDKYSSYMGSNSPMMTVETGVDGPSLLIFKDSYAHSLIPFLTAHYSKITVLDMRYINAGIGRLVKPQDYDSVLILYNAITFSSDTGIRKLNMK